MENVQTDDSLGDEAVPTVIRELGVSTTEHSDEVIFEGFDCPFSRVGAMVP